MGAVLAYHWPLCLYQGKLLLAPDEALVLESPQGQQQRTRCARHCNEHLGDGGATQTLAAPRETGLSLTSPSDQERSPQVLQVSHAAIELSEGRVRTPSPTDGPSM